MNCFYLTKSQISDAEQLLNSYSLSLDASYDSFFGIYDNNQLIATGARDKNVLKMVAVREDYQSTSAFSDIVNELIHDGFNNGFDHLFVFTKPIYYTNFEYLNFTPLCVSEDIAVMEFGRSIKDYLRRNRKLIREGNNSSIVMNCNPFTNGHRYLAEYASEHSDHVYIFVVEEDKSLVPFHDRLKLVTEGVEDIENITVLSAGAYAVSAITFPSYFIKEADKVTKCQMQLDLQIFGEKIAPAFNIKTRFAGQEPICGFTAKYNQMMLKVLPEFGVQPVQIERKSTNEEIISASKVRQLLSESNFNEIKKYVPSNTYEYLINNIDTLKERANRINRRHG